MHGSLSTRGGKALGRPAFPRGAGISRTERLPVPALAFCPVPNIFNKPCSLSLNLTVHSSSILYHRHHGPSVHTSEYTRQAHENHAKPPRRTYSAVSGLAAHDHTMKYFQQTVNFDYSWEEVSTSNWQKYGPWNEKTPHVIAVDTLSRDVDPATGIVRVSFTCLHPHTCTVIHPHPTSYPGSKMRVYY